jgi:hypothetical protein
MPLSDTDTTYVLDCAFTVKVKVPVTGTVVAQRVPGGLGSQIFMTFVT